MDGFTVPEQVGEVKTITLNVQIPLKKCGIQIKLFSAADRESELRSILATVLNNLRGETNWTTGNVALRRLTASDNYGAILLALAVGFILVGLIALLIISRKSARGTVLAIACVFYAASWIIPDSPIRELKMLTGTMRLFGCIAGVLGVVDAVRKRRRPADRGAANAPITAEAISEENPKT